MLFISLFVALCVKLDPGTNKSNAFSFGLKTQRDKSAQLHMVRNNGDLRSKDLAGVPLETN
jgi:hypothetical protein